MAQHNAALLDNIDAFLRTSSVADATFGREALNDPRFVAQLRAGRRVWPETEQKVRAYMERHAPAPCTACPRAAAGDIAACTAVDCPSRVAAAEPELEAA